MKSFQRGALGLAGALVAGLVVAAVVHPPAWATAPPRAGLYLAPSSTILPKAGLAGGLESLARMMARQPASQLAGAFSRLGYDLDSVSSGDDRVPRLFLASVPEDMNEIRETGVRKAVFLKTVLPLILQLNEEILADRARLWNLRTRLKLGEKLGAVDRLWLVVKAERHGVERGDVDGLLRRIDVIPPSLALAQAAEESGWGTSRFAREGNAIFGQWVFSRRDNLVPRRRDDDKMHKVKAFDSLLDSVRAYTHNLNTHAAYRDFRAQRAAMRRAGAPLDGAALANTLRRYSERGAGYIASIRRIIAANNLRGLDEARLNDQGPRPSPSI